MAYSPGTEAYGKSGGLEHSKDGMSHASHKNVSPAFDTGFMDAGHKADDKEKAKGGMSPTMVHPPQAANDESQADKGWH